VLKTKKRDPNLLPAIQEVIRAIKFFAKPNRKVLPHRRYGELFADKLADDLAAAKAKATGIGHVHATEAFLRVAYENETPEVRQAVIQSILQDKMTQDAMFSKAFHRSNRDISWAT
jgi:hypothetical protein